jgi:membrane associated rhomboid family serine protease
VGYNSVVINVIIIINIAVFVMWQGVNTDFMASNFLVSWDALADGRWWTLITSVFSHNAFYHILINMLVLKNFGDLIIRFMGRQKFIIFYLVAGVVASLGHSAVSAFIVGDPSIQALGASGAIAGCVMIFCLMFPNEKIYILGLLPVPAMFGALVFVGLDLWGLMAQAKGGGLPIGHGAHLGGAFTGVVWYLLFVRQRYRRVY